MTYYTEMKKNVEERYQFCIWLNLIKKNADKKNKDNRERGDGKCIKF